ncbi:MAG TPA: site-specific DNA-methyltransferase [Chthoniobacteraceae bacterium]|nr:site-specific DNA-methyltransferase [Chthoniobacteraceae bacterium]
MPRESSLQPLSKTTLEPKTILDLRLCDCVAGMRELTAESVDVAVTSPPYNLGVAYSNYSDDMAREKYLEWSLDWAAELKRVLKPDGSFFLNIGGIPSNPFLPHEIILKMRDLFVLQNTLHWIKSITIKPKKSGEVSAGHFKPINSKRYLTDCHEYLFHLTKTGDVKLDRLAVGVEYSDKSNIARWGHTSGNDKRCRGNNWFIPYETINSRDKDRPHPATFPVALAGWCMRLHGLREGMTALDPFLGIGSAALAARECEVAKFIGFEIDEQYLNEAKVRLGME